METGRILIELGALVELGILVALRVLVEAGILVARLRCIDGVRVEQYTMSTVFYFGIIGSNESNKCHQQCFKKIVRESGRWVRHILES